MKIFLFFFVKDKDLEMKRMIDEIDAKLLKALLLLKNVACLKFATEFFVKFLKRPKFEAPCTSTFNKMALHKNFPLMFSPISLVDLLH